MPRVTGRIASGRRTSKSTAVAAAVTEFRVVTVSIAGVAMPRQRLPFLRLIAAETVFAILLND